jgi:hypothetical protein
MLIEWYVINYVTLNGFINGVDWTFQDYINTLPKP